MSPRVRLVCRMMERLNCVGPVCSPLLHTHTHTQRYILYTHTFHHTLTHAHPPQCVHPLSTHGQTFTQVPPGFDGWSVRALPPVSYTYNLIWGGHMVGAAPKQGLIEASQAALSLPLPSQVASIIFCCLANMYDCSLLIKSFIIQTKKRAKLSVALFIPDNS